MAQQRGRGQGVRQIAAGRRPRSYNSYLEMTMEGTEFCARAAIMGPGGQEVPEEGHTAVVELLLEISVYYTVLPLPNAWGKGHHDDHCYR